MMIILDGVTPGNEGRGYILRRLLRRIIRSARLLGATGKTMESFMNTIMDTMTPSYPEIADNRERIQRVAITEETAFLKTLESGTELFETTAAKIKQEGKTTVAGADAFALHDTYGFPIDLTLEMAAEAGLQVDTEGFDKLMAEQRARAKADSQAKKHGHTDLSIYRDWVDNHPTEFIGYDELTAQSHVIGLLSDGKKVSEVSAGHDVEVILDASTFYAEAGGQIGDRGTMTLGDVQAFLQYSQQFTQPLAQLGGMATAVQSGTSTPSVPPDAGSRRHTSPSAAHCRGSSASAWASWRAGREGQ